MRSSSFLGLIVIATLIGACGPAVPEGDDDVTVPVTVTGRVWMPNQAPGLVPAGEEIPVFGAAVYLSATRPDPIPQQVYCERCADAPAGATYSGHDGGFAVTAYAGTYWLVIQKGQWRLERQVTLTETNDGQPLELADADTTLPSVMDPDQGQWIPKMAIALGTNDNIEDVLGKIGLGEYSPATYTFTGGGTEVTVFDDPLDLFGDLETLRQFHIVFFPCNTGIDPPGEFGGIPELNDQGVLDNIRRYVNEGGKMYVTDWSGEMVDHPFPPQIELGGGQDTVGTYDPVAFGGTITVSGASDGDVYDSLDAEAADPDLNDWLGLQLGPTPDDPTPAMFNPDRFVASDNWNWIASLQTVQTGVDPEGLPVNDVPKAWVLGSGPATGGLKKPLTVTFEPTGCGRVMFSTYQTANGHHAGLFPQERILLFLIAEIGVCSNVPIVN